MNEIGCAIRVLVVGGAAVFVAGCIVESVDPDERDPTALPALEAHKDSADHDQRYVQKGALDPLEAQLTALGNSVAELSRTLSAQTATIAALRSELAALRTPFGAYNLRLSYVNGRLSVACDDCRPGKPAFVTLPSVQLGRGVVSLNVQSGEHYLDDATSPGDMSDLFRVPFGTVPNTAWSADRPFFLYAINRDDTDAGLAFALSPDPRIRETTSASASLGDRSAPPQSRADSDMVLMRASDAASFVSKPLLRIGSLRMQKSPTDDWAVQPLSRFEGIGRYINETGTFTFPPGQMGAASNRYLVENASIPPAFLENTYEYRLSLTGMCRVTIRLAGDDGADGVGTGTVYVTVPYRNSLQWPSAFAVGRVSRTESTQETSFVAVLGPKAASFYLLMTGSRTMPAESVRLDELGEYRTIRLEGEYQAF